MRKLIWAFVILGVLYLSRDREAKGGGLSHSGTCAADLCTEGPLEMTIIYECDEGGMCGDGFK